MTTTTPKPPKKNGLPRVFARIPRETYAMIQALRDEYAEADGSLGTVSSVLRAFVVDGVPFMDKPLRERARAVQKRHGLTSMAAAWRAIVEAGLEALEKRKR